MRPVLDDINKEEEGYQYGSVLGWTLLTVSIFIWYLLYTAQTLPYDENYGNLILSFILSCLATAAILLLWVKYEKLIRQNIISVILFLFSSSPLTIALVIFNYQLFFNAQLQLS